MTLTLAAESYAGQSENCISSALLVEMELSQPFGSFGFLAIQFTNEASKDALKAS